MNNWNDIRNHIKDEYLITHLDLPRRALQCGTAENQPSKACHLPRSPRARLSISGNGAALGRGQRAQRRGAGCPAPAAHEARAIHGDVRDSPSASIPQVFDEFLVYSVVADLAL